MASHNIHTAVNVFVSPFSSGYFRKWKTTVAPCYHISQLHQFGKLFEIDLYVILYSNSYFEKLTFFMSFIGKKNSFLKNIQISYPFRHQFYSDFPNCNCQNSGKTVISTALFQFNRYSFPFSFVILMFGKNVIIWLAQDVKP